MKARHILAALVAATFASGALAQNLKPGLWEIKSKTQHAGGEGAKAMAQAQQEMAKMSPAERKQMEEVMGKHGMKMGGAPGETITKLCMTKEMVERAEMPVQTGNCKTTRNQRSGNTINTAFACTQPPSTGESQYTIAGPESYTMKVKVNSTGQGKTETMTTESSGKWLSADCGDLKPMKSPAAK